MLKESLMLSPRVTCLFCKLNHTIFYKSRLLKKGPQISVLKIGIVVVLVVTPPPTRGEDLMSLGDTSAHRQTHPTSHCRGEKTLNLSISSFFLPPPLLCIPFTPLVPHFHQPLLSDPITSAPPHLLHPFILCPFFPIPPFAYHRERSTSSSDGFLSVMLCFPFRTQ